MASEQTGWHPQKTRIFAVGLLEWQHPALWSSFPDAVEGRWDVELVNFFREQGVPETQLIYLQDQEATLEQIQGSLVELLSAASPGDLLILYFAGHGTWDADSGQYYFVNYDATDHDESYWSVSSIIDAIEERFSGSQALLLADCCYSGGLIEVLQQQERALAYACVTSAYCHNSSTDIWTFTESLVKGWQGDPQVDLDGDGLITLQDIARYVELEMAFVEEQKSMGFTLNNFDPQMQLARVSSQAGSRGKEERIEVEFEETWYKAKLLEQDGEQARIHYVVDNSEAWVNLDRIRPYDPLRLAMGTSVQVEYEAQWYPATVKWAWYGLHFISYDGYPDTWDEWISSDRLHAESESTRQFSQSED